MESHWQDTVKDRKHTYIVSTPDVGSTIKSYVANDVSLDVKQSGR